MMQKGWGAQNLPQGNERSLITGSSRQLDLVCALLARPECSVEPSVFLLFVLFFQKKKAFKTREQGVKIKKNKQFMTGLSTWQSTRA